MILPRPGAKAGSGSAAGGASRPGRHCRLSAFGLRRREFGGAAAVFLTFSVLLLVMALGFVFGRVVIARAYIRGIGVLAASPEAAPRRDQTSAPASTIFAPSVQQETTTGGEEAAPQAASQNPPDEPAPASDLGSEEPPEQAPTPEAQEPPAAPREEAAGDVRYAVQVGLFDSEGSARDTLRQLTRAGHPCRIEVDRQPSRTLYRVLSGSYRNEANARKALDEIKGEGFVDAFVVAR